MDVQILHLVDGAKAARGTTVIIDVFRAFTVETYLALNHADRIIPVGDIQTAFDYKKEHPDAILCGERGGAKIEGFDYGNSPSQVENVDFTGKTVVHTTSAGTQGIVNAAGATEILAGSMVAAKAIADYIKLTKPQHVSLVCMGLSGTTRTDEDELCGEYIKSLIEGKPIADIRERLEKIRYTDGAKFFDPARQHIFPQRDFALSTKVSVAPFVLRLKKDAENGLSYMERINIADLPKNELPAGAPVVLPPILPSDMASQFNREQSLSFPQDVKKILTYGSYQEPEGEFDAGLVLGGNGQVMKSRAEAAAKLYHAGQCKLFITTGGVYQDTVFGSVPEAKALALHMMEAGVPESCILMEDRATTTIENMTCSRKMLAEIFGSRKLRLAVITSYFHVVRSVKLAQAHIENAEFAGVKAEFPFDDPEQFHLDPVISQRVNTECRLLCNYAKRGIIADFPVLNP